MQQILPKNGSTGQYSQSPAAEISLRSRGDVLRSAAPPRRRTRTTLGWAAVAAVVALWSSFALSARAVEGTGLTMADAAIVRFAVPALVLSPWIPRTLRALRGERITVVALILAAGLPHYLLFAWGAHLTSAALTGLLVPGTVPLFVAILLFARSRRCPPGGRMLALAAIIAGVGASAAFTAGSVQPGGIAVLIAAGFVWAAYTRRNVPVRPRSDRGDPAGLPHLRRGRGRPRRERRTAVAPLRRNGRPGALGGYAVVQGVGTGLLSTACYVVAVKNLGSSMPAAAGALSPVSPRSSPSPCSASPSPPVSPSLWR